MLEERVSFPINKHKETDLLLNSYARAQHRQSYEKNAAEVFCLLSSFCSLFSFLL